MSVDLDWQKLDSELGDHVKDFLNKHFQSITKPAFIGDIEITAFDWGNETPQIEITNITNPFPEFYEEDEQDENNSATRTPQSDQKNRQHASSLAPSDDYYLDNNSLQTYNTIRPSFTGTPLLHQQQRFNMIHSFHRSPLVAPQHPFNMHQNNYFSPMTNTAIHASPPSSSAISWPSRPASLLDEDWIDDEEINCVPDDTLPAHSTSIIDSKATEMDFQVHMLISYKGDMRMTIMTELRMNYPSVMFMSLPMQLCVRSVEFEATAVIGYIQSMNRICVSMLEDTNSRGKDGGLNSLLRDVHIESIVGDEQKQGNRETIVLY